MTISLGVKKILQQITTKHYDIPVSQCSLSVGLKLTNRVKLTVKWWIWVCIDLFQSIWDQLKFRVNELQMDANKSTAEQFFGKASGTKDAWPTAWELLCYRYIHSFPFQKNVVFHILIFLPILVWKYSMTCIILKL